MERVDLALYFLPNIGFSPLLDGSDVDRTALALTTPVVLGVLKFFLVE